MNINRGNRNHPEAERADGAGGGMLGRRGALGALGGLAAIPVLSGLTASAASAADVAAGRRGGAPAAAGLALGTERRYSEPLLAAGTRLVLPAGVKAVPVRDYYTSARLAATASAWPHLRAADGSVVDASVVPERGAPSVIAVLSGLTEGWYEIRHANGRNDRVTWDGSAMPFLRLHGEFGGTSTYPYSLFYTLSLQPMSANPYSLATTVS